MESYLMSSGLIDNSLRGEKVKKAGAAAKEAKKKRLSDEQVKLLEFSFGMERKLDCRRKELLAIDLNLHPKQVAVWFQNRRARLKNRQIEEKYLRLKSENEESVIEKCQLEKEVLKLKKKLSETEEEIKRLLTGMNRDQNDLRALESSSSSLSTANHQAASEEINAVEEQECFNFNHDFMYNNCWMGWGDEFFKM